MCKICMVLQKDVNDYDVWSQNDMNVYDGHFPRDRWILMSKKALLCNKSGDQLRMVTAD